MGPAGEPAARERGRATGIGVDGALITGEGHEVGGFCARPSIQKAKVSNVGKAHQVAAEQQRVAMRGRSLLGEEKIEGAIASLRQAIVLDGDKRKKARSQFAFEPLKVDFVTVLLFSRAGKPKK